MEASNTLQSEQIGALLVEKNLITVEQLERALALQEESGGRLGEIVVAEFGVSRLEVAGVLAEQWAGAEKPDLDILEPIEPLTPAEVQLRRPLGELLVMRGLISNDQLHAALDEQRKSGARIGEILVERGAITRLDLATALADHGSAAGVALADLQPAPNGSLEASGPAQARLVELEARLHALERAAGGAPWQEDLRLLAFDIRAAVSAVEERLEARAPGPAETELGAALAAVSVRIEALEQAPVAAELAALRQELEELKTRPLNLEGIADLRAAVARLEAQPDRTDEIPHLADEVTTLAARLDQLHGSDELKNRLEVVAEKAELAQTGIAGLSRRVDELAGLESRLDEVAAILPGSEALEDIHTTLSGLGARAANHSAERSADQASLVARLDELAARVDHIAAAPSLDLSPRIDVLAARVDEVTAAIPAVETDGLKTRIELLEEGSRTGNGALERLSTEIGELGSRTSERLDALAASVPDSLPVDELRARVDELRAQLHQLSAAMEQQPDTALLDMISSRLDEVAAAAVGHESAALLEARVSELEHRVALATPAAELREEVQRIAASSVVERETLAQTLFARVEEITASVPHADELADLRSRLEELAGRPAEDHLLQVRVDELSVRLDGLGAIEGTVAGLSESLARLDGLRGSDSFATGQRLEALEAAIDSLAGLEARVREGVDHDLVGLTGALASRLDGAESRLDSVVALEQRVAALAADLKRRPDGDDLALVAGELRAELAALADDTAIADLGGQLRELSRKFDASEHDGASRIGRLAEDVDARIGGLAGELGRRIDDIAGRAEGLVSRDEAAATVTEQATWIRKELEELREQARAHAAAVDVVLAEADDARVTGQQELRNRLDTATRAVRADVETQARALGARLETSANETAALQARVQELQEAAAERVAWEARLERMLDQRLDGLAARIANEVAGARADAVDAVNAVREETGSLGARIDELHGLREVEMHDVRATSERLAERVETLAGLRAGDAEAARAAVAGLSARLDDQALRSAEAAFVVEQALREEIGGVAARLEESDASGIEARDGLRGELERVASSVGWRLERIEESLASDDLAVLKATVTELGRSLEEQAAIGEEQARATERALRKGLASLGERLVDTESAYAVAGNALRRSIERLGAAVVEADARIADQIPVSEAEGCVAFAPTGAGYRLVELPGAPPELGTTIEVDGCEGSLLVTRYGRSPLPLDNRPCAYLDRA